jgi:hypothetical protein
MQNLQSDLMAEAGCGTRCGYSKTDAHYTRCVLALPLAFCIPSRATGRGRNWKFDDITWSLGISCSFRRSYSPLFSAETAFTRLGKIASGFKRHWRFSTLLSLVLAESIALYGFVLRFMGASRRVSWPFFVCALILMVVWRPQLELSAGLSGTEPNQ